MRVGKQFQTGDAPRGYPARARVESRRFSAFASAAFHDSAGSVFALAGRGRSDAMLFIVFVCLLLWFLGFMTTTTLGGALHVLLIIAVVFLLLHVIQGRPIGE